MKGILNGTRAIIRLTDNVGTTNQATLMGPHSHHKGPIGIIGALKILALPKRGGGGSDPAKIFLEDLTYCTEANLKG